MTGPSSGDRPTEETCDPACPGSKCERRGLAWCPATPPAVRTGDEGATVETHEHRWSRWAVGYRRQCLDCRSWDEQDGARAALSTPPPVSGTATRDDVARWLRSKYALRDFDGSGSWLADADELLALGGSQPAAQPVQPAEEQRPIDLLTRQGDEELRARVETVMIGLDRAAAVVEDEDDDTVKLVRVVVSDLRRALDGGGNRG